ncbi:MAG: hypothetical protein ACRDIV_06055, partial [Ktedonobacteraceae bacterium]
TSAPCPYRMQTAFHYPLRLSKSINMEPNPRVKAEARHSITLFGRQNPSGRSHIPLPVLIGKIH